MRFNWNLAGIVLACVCTAAVAEDWPQFRGPGGMGLSSQAKLPESWSAEKNIEWKAEIPGVAWSQPIVWQGKIYVTTAISEKQTKPRAQGGGGGFGGGFGGGRPGGAPGAPGGRPPGGGGFGGGRGGGAAPDAVYQWKLICLDSATGKPLWDKLVHEGKPAIPIHRTNTYASETPITDGERLYVYFGMTGLYCFDMEGKELWKKELGNYRMMNGWGAGSSPAIDDARIYVQCDNEESSFMVAFDKKTGNEIWREKRSEKSNWATPFIWKNKQRSEVVTGGGTRMRSYDPATGKLLWELGGMSGRCSASPVGDDEHLYVGTGGGMGGSGPLMAVKAGATGDITPSGSSSTSDGVAWTVSRGGPSMASPLLYQGNLYVADQRGGLFACYDAKTGKQHYKERIPGAKGFTSSPWAAGGKVFALDEDGSTFVLEAGPKLNVVATNKLDDMFWSSAAVVGDKLLLRGVDRLYCIKP